ncbi:MAG: MFS transporter [Verrucomicrobiia bacterium]
MSLVSSENGVAKKSILQGVTFYHWLVVIIASCGWLFDCMDQRIFILSRQPALKELVYKEYLPSAAKGNTPTTATPQPADEAGLVKQKEIADALVKKYIGWATTIMILGWATGGIIFGMLSDKWGRVKTMVATLLVYSGFTGLSGVAQNVEQFLAFRFLVGLGVGGMFGAATTLVAESVPGNFRAVALGSLQALSATGNIMGSLISLKIPPGMENFWAGHAGWRVLFFVGILPALLSIPVIFLLKEPEAWKQAKDAAARGEVKKKVGSPIELFKDKRWRRNAIVGLMLGLSGMIGLWGIAFFSPELISEALKGADQKTIDTVRGWGTAMQDAGAFLGMLTFTWLAAALNRRLAFLISFILCAITVIFVFNFLHKPTDAYWMLPMMGFATLSVFAGYSIYFPELFPTRLRGTGVGFCYNTVRYLAAPAPTLFGYLSTQMPFRTVATVMSAIFLLGLFALIWAPETKGKPLPED